MIDQINANLCELEKLAISVLNEEIDLAELQEKSLNINKYQCESVARYFEKQGSRSLYSPCLTDISGLLGRFLFETQIKSLSSFSFMWTVEEKYGSRMFYGDEWPGNDIFVELF